MPLAIFDLDHTLLDGDSEALWCAFLYDQDLVDDGFIARIGAYYQDYLSGELDMPAYERFLLRPLIGLEPARLEDLRRRYLETLLPRFRPALLARVKRHRSGGDVLLMITASNSLVVAPIADRLGFPGLICTQVESTGGSLTGDITGRPAFRQGKVDLLQAWLGRTGRTLSGSWGYSDSHNDLPLLSMVDHPVAVTPDPQLRAHADQHGWEIIESVCL